MGSSGINSYNDSSNINENLDYQNRSSNDIKKSNKKRWIIGGIIVGLILIMAIVGLVIAK